jgi:hypothetical protein
MSLGGARRTGSRKIRLYNRATRPDVICTPRQANTSHQVSDFLSELAALVAHY